MTKSVKQLSKLTHGGGTNSNPTLTFDNVLHPPLLTCKEIQESNKKHVNEGTRTYPFNHKGRPCRALGRTPRKLLCYRENRQATVEAIKRAKCRRKRCSQHFNKGYSNTK